MPGSTKLTVPQPSTLACVCLAGTVCGGHTHAWREGDRCDCQGGGVAQKPKSGNHTSSRVENHLKDMKAITRLKGAAAMTTAMVMSLKRLCRAFLLWRLARLPRRQEAN